MKTLFLKNIVPFAVIAMGVSGAFLTTSMQKAPKSLIPNGYVLNSENVCNVEVNCSDDSSKPVCRQFGTTGQQAFGNPNNCNIELYRP
jgi:hypothetical protein